MCFYLYAQSEKSEELLDFLKAEEIKHNSGQPIYFDVTYALNVCKQNQSEFKKALKRTNDAHEYAALQKKILNMSKAQIILFGILNVYSKAVELALECDDVDVAKDYANQPMDKKVQRELWMKIANHLFSSSREGRNELNMQKALEFIRRHSKLKVEDLLEQFPRDARVEDMKEHLCRCLEDYEEKIKALRDTIEKNSSNAETLRNQKRNLRNKHITINPTQTCDICYATVFDREFLVFPCLHAFHRECISAILRDESYEPKDSKVNKIVKDIRKLYRSINEEYQAGRLTQDGGPNA